ncbi:hypothetical protein SISNIDRAFT_467934 [Sistotremastrum niveocremeum HHB9708]|uniref:Uncharacterized protein n=1 Tax=Sistotremastrum niveocremeum HHB9708 TaxID=1314777 RepID=A0A164RYB1_9AGAM|nr:hypothetical protein SISNIDRAFT_502781 [Sistotremastrum niveocremeum HHB9708]KZS90995.1 hypothetical protein SISNIDRAFT_467934 [Sistotremastrum niveocremeum HHB9708]
MTGPWPAAGADRKPVSVAGHTKMARPATATAVHGHDRRLPVQLRLLDRSPHRPVTEPVATGFWCHGLYTGLCIYVYYNPKCVPRLRTLIELAQLALPYGRLGDERTFAEAESTVASKDS